MSLRLGLQKPRNEKLVTSSPAKKKIFDGLAGRVTPCAPLGDRQQTDSSCSSAPRIS